MLSTVELDYIQHLERGYCENHPDVIAETKDQVVDRAVKQLLTALQSNGFELDGNILKRGTGWLQYDATSSAWQYSNDAGVTWQDMGSGGITDHTLLTNIGTNTHAAIDTFMTTLPAEVASPVILGTTRLKDDSGDLEVSHDNGATWNTVFDTAQDLNLTSRKFYAPFISQEAEPSTFAGSLTFWKQPSTGDVWLIYKDTGGVVQKIALGLFPYRLRYNSNDESVEIFDGITWAEVYRAGHTLLNSTFFVPPKIWGGAQPTQDHLQMQNNGSMAFWVDTADNNRTYLLFYNGYGVRKVELV